MTKLPDDLPVIERNVVRLVVQDVLGRVLLFRTRELSMPELRYWWELPGGGIEEGESYVETAVRELREEAGINVAPDQVGPAWWRRTASFRHRNFRRLQHEVSTSLVPMSTDVNASTTRQRTTSIFAGPQWQTSWPAPSGSTRDNFHACFLICLPVRQSTSRLNCGPNRRATSQTGQRS